MGMNRVKYTNKNAKYQYDDISLTLSLTCVIGLNDVANLVEEESTTIGTRLRTLIYPLPWINKYEFKIPHHLVLFKNVFLPIFFILAVVTLLFSTVELNWHLYIYLYLRTF